MKIFNHSLKTSPKVLWFQAGLACLIFTASAAVGYGQVTNWVGVFNSSADAAQWTHAGGDANSATFVAGDTPPWGGPSTGCLEFQSAFGPGLTWTVLGKSVGSLNASTCTALEMDIKIGTNQTVFDTSYNACNSFQVGVSYGSSQTWAIADSGAITPVARYNGWWHLSMPASRIGGANWANVRQILLEPTDNYYTASGNMVIRIANVKLTGPGSPSASVNIGADAASVVRTADTRLFAMNTGNYDYDFNLSHTVPESIEAGITTWRYPGGSTSDTYHWAHETQNNNKFANFAMVATNLGAPVFITVNYGTGTPEEAAGWVASANVTNHYGFKYWEIGNEIYAIPTETDTNIPSHDPYTYATRAATYIQQMKAVDPTIKCGAIVVKGMELDWNNYNSHPATNLLTGQVFYGWTAVVMSRLRQLGVTPDFAIYHHYPQNYSAAPDNDQFLLSKANWAEDAAEIRGCIDQFLGPAGTNTEIVITENNNDEATPGKQSVSLVNALYYADSIGQIMQTEINSRVWWQWHDGGPSYNNGDLSTSLYGWRIYGAFGMNDYLNGLQMTNRYPPYFAAKMVSRFIRGGDKVVKAVSDNPLVSAYSALRTNGSLTLMAINKSSNTTCTANIMLANYLPGGTATVYSYGMTQDNAAQAGNNSTCDIATNSYSASTNFSYALAPYSITVFAFASAPSLSVLPSADAGQLVVQLAGQSGVPYVLQTSTNLSDWTSIATNTLTGNVLNITNPITSGEQFWRAAWLP
ncbi:MAG: hypothetical protein ABSA45_06870 [Verrucomicrobiota bacterium]|jgi:hypothetical protein